MPKQILMIAGPNGAGKTTMTLELLENQHLIYEYVNADEIARGLAPLHPESVALTASKLMLSRMKELLKEEKSFAFETTAAGTNYIKHLKQAKSKGYNIHLTFLWLASPQHAIERVEQRVKHGGHHVPRETITRRYFAGLKNLVKYYLPIADSSLIVDNSSEESSKHPIAEKDSHPSLKIFDEWIWKKIETMAYEKKS